MSTDDDALNTRRQTSKTVEDSRTPAASSTERLPKKYWIVEHNLPPGFVRHSKDSRYFWVRDFPGGQQNSFVKFSVRVYPEIANIIIHIKVVDVERGSNVLHRSKVHMISKRSDWLRRLGQRLGPILVNANNKCRRPPQPPTPVPAEYSLLADALLPGFRYHEPSETNTALWILWPNKSSNLSVEVYPYLPAKTISIKVVYAPPVIEGSTATSTTSEVEITKWSHEVSMTGGDNRWKTSLAERLGEASVQAKKQPKCPTCKKPAVLRIARYGQFFGCSSFPRCRGSLSIGDFQTELPQVFFDQTGQQNLRARAA